MMQVTDCQEWFHAEVRLALNSLYNPPILRKSPLVAVFGLQQKRNPGLALQALLLEAIEGLRPKPAAPTQSDAWRHFQVLRRRYTEQAQQAQVAGDLGLSTRQLQRTESLARTELADHLWHTHRLAEKLAALTAVIEAAAATALPGGATPLPGGATLLPGGATPSPAAATPSPAGATPSPAGGDLRAPSRAEELNYLSRSLPVEQVQVQQAVLDAVATIQPLAAAAAVTVRTEVPPDLPSLLVQGPLLHQALVNLTCCAIAAAGGGPVTLAAYTQGPDVVISIRAAGPASLPADAPGPAARTPGAPGRAAPTPEAQSPTAPLADAPGPTARTPGAPGRAAPTPEAQGPTAPLADAPDPTAPTPEAQGPTAPLAGAQGRPAASTAAQTQELLETAGQLVTLCGGQLTACPAPQADGAPALQADGAPAPQADGTPALQADGAPAPPFGAELALPALEQTLVLVVDDNVDTQQLYGRLLAGSRYRLAGARNGHDGLEQALARRPAVILLDVMMPHQDGWTLLGQLRNHAASRTIPVIVCSILPQEQLALALGAGAFLRKPLNRTTLLAALDRQLARRGPASAP
jgi:CheY-like chemotaxis protein